MTGKELLYLDLNADRTWRRMSWAVQDAIGKMMGGDVTIDDAASVTATDVQAEELAYAANSERKRASILRQFGFGGS